MISTELLNTEDHRCPETMIMSRRFLRKALSDTAVAKIVSIEPSLMRDIPYYCQHEGLYLMSHQARDGKYEFLVAKNDKVATQYQAQATRSINIVDVGSDKQLFDKHLHTRFSQLVDDFKRLMQAGYQLVFPCSFGKDSKLTLTAGLTAHEALMQETGSAVNSKTPFVVIHIDTGVEVVPMDMYSHHAMYALRSYCHEKEINLELHHQRPPIHEQFASLFIGARKLPSTPSMNSDCAVIWKVQPSEKIQRSLLNKYGMDRVVSCLGSRNSEGAKRKASLIKYGNDKRTVSHLIETNESGLQTFAPIIDWTNEEVFGALQRCGTQPLVMTDDRYRLPAFMPSYRLLIQIYGDSSNDTCEINMGAHKANQAGCGGNARNGCHQCFKAGGVDKSVVAHNQQVRWHVFQHDANKVRDWVYSIAHDLSHRTFHPRTFDPVTNHAIMQPNILNARTLERMLTYYVQLTEDDRLRAQRFTSLVADGREMDDEGYADIANDTTMDPITKAEFLAMYKTQAQRHIIKIATLEHCIFLSAQWAMDGVKSLPYRPLKIWDNVVNHQKRIPYPSGPVRTAIDNVPDAFAVRMCEPGVDFIEQWVPAHRPWDIMEADVANGCAAEKLPHRMRVNVKYVKATDTLTVVSQGKVLPVGTHTEQALLKQAREKCQAQDAVSFTSHLSYRKTHTLDTVVSLKPRQAKGQYGFTRRTRRKNKAGGFDVGRTSLQMYRTTSQSRYEDAHLRDMTIWVPDFAMKSVPLIAQHQINGEAGTVNFDIGREAINEWLLSGGLEKALSVHDVNVKRVRSASRRDGGRFTLRQFVSTFPMWELFQHGLMSVNANSWNTVQSSAKRTELFCEIGLFDLSDNVEVLRSQPGVVDMAAHRSYKAGVLLSVRAQRNERRREAKSRVNAMKVQAVQPVVTRIKARMATLLSLRTQISGTTMMDAKVISNAGVTSFDHIDFKATAQLAEDWLNEYGVSLGSVDKFLSMFATKEEQAIVQANIPQKLQLSEYLNTENAKYLAQMQQQYRHWERFASALSPLKRTSDSATTDKTISQRLDAIAVEFDDLFSHFSYISHGFVRGLTGYRQSMMALIHERDTLLPLSAHQAAMEGFVSVMKALKTQLGAMQQELTRTTPLGHINGLDRMAGLKQLYKELS